MTTEKSPEKIEEFGIECNTLIYSDSNSSSSVSRVGNTSREELTTSVDHEIVLKGIAEKHGVNPVSLQWKVDLCIILPLCILYLLAFLDRVNIANANAYSMGKDIGLVGQQYNIALAIFFVPYIVFEIPANWALKKLSPHVWLAFCLICFGGISIGQGFVKNYGQLVVTRFLLGLMETSMFPSCFYLLGSWYMRKEAQKRYSFFFCSTSLAGAFAGLIAYGVNAFHMKFGIAGWRWIFIIEGAVTVFCGIVLFFVLADFPEEAKFLRPNEREYVKEKLALDQGESNFEHKVTICDILIVFKDWKVYASALMYFGQLVGAYGYAYFSVAIIQSFGYSPVNVQFYSIYPWISCFVINMLVAFLSDYFGNRYFFIVFSTVLAVVGYGLLLGTKAVISNNSVRYSACFLVSTGIFCSMSLIVCWTNMNFAGHSRKMTATAFQVGFANFGGIIAPFVYRSQDAPNYKLGIGVSLALVLFSLAACIVYFVGIMKINADRKQGNGCAAFDLLTKEEQALAGDLNPSFKYMY